MLSIENPHQADPSLSCTSEISQLNSRRSCSSSGSRSRNDDQEASGVLQSDLLISCPKFTTIRNHAFSKRSKDINTNWPFSGKSLELCLDHGVKDLLPPFQSVDAMKPPSAQRCTIATSLVSKESEYHRIDQASRPTNRRLLSASSCNARPSLASVYTSSRKSEGVRQFSSMIVEAETSLNYSASKPVKKSPVVANKAENIIKPSTKKCRDMVKSNNTAADQNKLENNASNNVCETETMTSNFCPVCKTFTSSSNTTLNAHIDQCLSGKSISRWTSDPKETQSRVKPKRMRSMVEIYETAQHCTIEELERRNGINLAASSSLPPQDMEVGSKERKRKSPVNFEEIENEGDVYVDANGTKLRILSKLTDLSSRAMESDETGIRRHVDDDKRSKISSAKKKKKKLQEKHHKLHSRVSDIKKFFSPKNHQNSKITGIQEHANGPEKHLEVEEAVAKPQRAHCLVKYIEPESVCRRACSKRSVLTKSNDKGGNLHPTLTRKRELADVNNVESPRYSYINGGCGSKSNDSSGTPLASPRSSEPHDDHKKVLSLRRNVRTPFRSEPFNDKNNPLGEVKQRNIRESNSSVECQNKAELRNKLNPSASLSVQKKRMKSALTRNASSVSEKSKHFPNGHDLSSKPRDFSSVTKKHSSRLSSPQASSPEFTFGPKCKCSGLKRRRAYSESESDGEEIMRQTVAKTSDNATISRKAFKVSRDRGKVKVSEKGNTLVTKGMESTSKHCEPPIDGINDSYSDKVSAGLDDEKGSTQKDVGPSEKDVVDEETCNNPLFETSEGLCKSSDVQCPEVAGHLDVKSDSSGYMKFCDGTSLGTEDARYPVESVLNGGEKMSYIDEHGKSIFGQDVHARTELLPNDGSDSYNAEVDLIPIPGPPGSFLPSPSPDEFLGNSAPTSSQDQSSKNHREFADRESSDSPSPTSTISNSDIGKFDSSLYEKLPFRYSIQDVTRSSVSDVNGGTMVNKISPDPSTSFAGGEGLDPVQPTVDLLYTETAAPLLQNDQSCSCSRKDVAVHSPAVLNYQDSSLLSWPTVPPIPESHFNTQVNLDETRRAKNCNSMLNVPYSRNISGELHYSSGEPLRPISHKACNDSGLRFFFNTDGETVSPPTSNPVFRLMGKDVMVVKKDETSDSHQTAKEKIVINDACESSADLASYPIHGMGMMNHRQASTNPAFMASAANPMNFISLNGFQPETSHSGSSPLAQTATFQMPPTVNPLPINWNYGAQGSNFVPRGSFESSPYAAPNLWWSQTNHSGGFP